MKCNAMGRVHGHVCCLRKGGFLRQFDYRENLFLELVALGDQLAVVDQSPVGTYGYILYVMRPPQAARRSMADRLAGT